MANLNLLIIILMSSKIIKVTSTCPNLKFTCYSGKCVNIQKICNGVNDCLDNSDENNCNQVCRLHYHYCCPNGDYHCTNGNCVRYRLKCNGEDDCGNNSDEEHICDHVFDKCLEIDFQCRDKKKCIAYYWVCDGVRDCDDNSDEDNCTSIVLPNSHPKESSHDDCNCDLSIAITILVSLMVCVLLEIITAAICCYMRIRCFMNAIKKLQNYFGINQNEQIVGNYEIAMEESRSLVRELGQSSDL